MSSLLGDSKFIQFHPNLAFIMEGELSLAIALTTINHVSTWPGGKQINGEKWIWNTYEAWQRDWFPYWTTRNIQNVMNRLEKLGLIKTCQPDGHLSRKKYYLVTEAAKRLLTQSKVEDMRKQLVSRRDQEKFSSSDKERTSSSHQEKFSSWDQEKTSSSITDNTTDNTTENTTPIVPLGQVVGLITPEQIYAEYPLKVGRGAAIKAIAKALTEARKTDGGAAGLLRATMDYAEATAKWPEADRKFIPHPSTWFNQQRYNDDPATWVRKSGRPEGTSARIAAALGYQDGM